MCLSMLAVLMDMFAMICCFPPVAQNSDLVCVGRGVDTLDPIFCASCPHPTPSAPRPAPGMSRRLVGPPLLIYCLPFCVFGAVPEYRCFLQLSKLRRR